MDKVYKLSEWRSSGGRLPEQMSADLAHMELERASLGACEHSAEGDALFLCWLRVAVEEGWRVAPGPRHRGGGWFDARARCWPGDRARRLYPAVHYEADLRLLDSEPLVTLAAVPLAGDTLLFNLTPLNSLSHLPTVSVALLVSRYVKNSGSKWEERLKSLDELSEKVRPSMEVMRGAVVECVLGYRASLNSLPGLPEEVFTHLVDYLTVKEIVRLAVTCKLLHEVVTSNSLWRRLYLRDFGPHEPPPGHAYLAYVQRYLQMFRDTEFNHRIRLPSSYSISYNSDNSFHFPEHYNSSYFL